MKTRRKAVLLATLLIGLHAFVIFPAFFSPYDYAAQNRELPFAPPTHLHFVDQAGHFHPLPFIYPWKEASSSDRRYEEDRTKSYSVRFLTRGDHNRVFGNRASGLHLFGVDEPGQIFLFGTDDFGRDQFSRMLFGGRVSLLAGLMGATIALIVGGTLGVLSGYHGKWLDSAIMRFVELFLALPWLYLLFAVRAILPLGIKTTDAFLLLVGVVGLVGWARPARLVRGIVLSAKEKDYILAARAMGASDAHILRRHVLPQTYGTMLTMAAILVPQFMLAEVTLSFLGLGVGEPMPSWGNLLLELQKYSVLTSYWWMYLPAIALVILFLTYHWTATVLQERFAAVSV
jgi:peptide/nickel transport system permease protein